MFKAYYFSLLRQRVTKSAKVQKPLPFVLGFIARVPEMNYRKSVCERKRLLKAMKGRMEKGKKGERKSTNGREQESHLCLNNWERKEKQKQNNDIRHFCY